MNNEIFLNQTFKLYKSNKLLPKLSNEQVDYILLNLSKFLYKNYKTQNNDLILQYQSHQEILDNLKLTNNEKEYNGFKICYLFIKHSNVRLFPRSIIIFITKENTSKSFNTLVLHRITNPLASSFIISLIENLDLQVPIIIKDYKLTYNYIKIVLNQLSSKLSNHYSTFIKDLLGDIELVYSLKNGNINENLRNIIINIPNNDLEKFRNNANKFHLLDSINDFLFATSKINFDKLSIVKFNSDLINLFIDGKLRISGEKFHLIQNLDIQSSASDFSTEHHIESNREGETVIDNKDALIWFLISSVYNENLNM